MDKKTKIHIIFSVLMALIMVYGMEIYNSVLREHYFSLKTLLLPVNEIIIFIVFVIIFQNFIARPIVLKITNNLKIFSKDKEITKIIITTLITVCIMCPLMSFVATLSFNKENYNILNIWLITLAHNFPFALIWQLLIAGPFVRKTVSLIEKFI